MAAIDKIYVSSYYAFNEFRLWCLIHKPSLLNNFYNPFITYEEWYKNKKEWYDVSLRCHAQFLKDNPNREEYSNPEEWDIMKRECELFADEEKCIETKEFPITNFTLKQDRYLLWHCPIDFVRDYLEENCGYKTRWYHKLFFKD